jgi:chromosome segregation ATPase
MRLVVGDTAREGRAIDATDLASPDTLLAVIRDEAPAGDLELDAPAPGPAHEFVGRVDPGMSLALRPALAAAARSRGLSAPQDERITALREELAALDPDPVATREARQSVAETGAEVDRLRERVAELRGRVRAREDAGLDATAAREELTDAVQRLSEVETEHVAATERLDRATAAAREARDARERRLRLADRLDNREREARAHLVDRVSDEYRTAVRDVPGGPDGHGDPFEVDPVTAALAVARVADLAAPVVLACDRFASPTAAADWLDAPVLAL